MQELMSTAELKRTLQRMAFQLVENLDSLQDVVLIGIQPRGTFISDKLVAIIRGLFPNEKCHYGLLDITFYRDDIRSELHKPNDTHIPFSIENKTVILIDDVLYTGRTTRAALDALQDFGRPKKVLLCVLINRRFNRELPIQPDCYGKAIDTSFEQKVKVMPDQETVVID
jgi:pyrimidine operon attenuation protein/uracil phosphoribosyltransferase